MSTTQHSDTTAWRVSAAPHYGELLWKNLRCAPGTVHGAGEVSRGVAPQGAKPVTHDAPGACGAFTAQHAGVAVRCYHSECAALRDMASSKQA